MRTTGVCTLTGLGPRSGGTWLASTGGLCGMYRFQLDRSACRNGLVEQCLYGGRLGCVTLPRRRRFFGKEAVRGKEVAEELRIAARDPVLCRRRRGELLRPGVPLVHGLRARKEEACPAKYP